MQQPASCTFLRLRDVMDRVKLSRTQIYRLIAKRRFPPPVKLGERASAWIESEVDAWIQQRIVLSRTSGLRAIPAKPMPAQIDSRQLSFRIGPEHTYEHLA